MLKPLLSIYTYAYVIESLDNSCSGEQLSTGGSKSSSVIVSSLFSCVVPKPLKSISLICFSPESFGVASHFITYQVFSVVIFQSGNYSLPNFIYLGRISSLRSLHFAHQILVWYNSITTMEILFKNSNLK